MKLIRRNLITSHSITLTPMTSNLFLHFMNNKIRWYLVTMRSCTIFRWLNRFGGFFSYYDDKCHGFWLIDLKQRKYFLSYETTLTWRTRSFLLIKKRLFQAEIFMVNILPRWVLLPSVKPVPHKWALVKNRQREWSIRVDWPLKHVNNGTRKVKTQANISAKFALFFVSNCKAKVLE